MNGNRVLVGVCTAAICTAGASAQLVLSQAAGFQSPRVTEQLLAIEGINGVPYVGSLETSDLGFSVFDVIEHGVINQLSTSYAGNDPVRATLADFDLDGDLDPMIAMPNTNRIALLRNELPTEVSFGFTIVMPGKPVDVAAADFNGDGRIDVVAACEAEGGIRVALQQPNGLFTAEDAIPTGTFPTAVVTGDFDGDSLPDIAVTNFVSSTMTVLWNTTPLEAETPEFGVIEQISTGAGATDLLAVDLDLDGDLDFAGLNSVSGLAFTFVNLGNGLIANRTLMPAGSAPTNLVSADVNGDAYPDLLAGTTSNTNAFSVFINDGSGAFARLTVPTSFKPQSVTTADINDDQMPDLIIADGQQRRMATYINETEPAFQACAGDTDNDARVGISDLLSLLSQFGESGPDLAGDVDQNGQVNISDLLIILSNYGNACGAD